VIKRYHRAATPYQRLLDDARTPKVSRLRLKAMYLTLDPVRLLRDIRLAQVLFDQPIYVKRTNYIEEITCVEDALDFLEEWPLEGRNLVYEVTLKALRGAMTHSFPLNASYETFKRFAKRAGLLCSVEDVPVVGNRAAFTALNESCDPQAEELQVFVPQRKLPTDRVSSRVPIAVLSPVVEQASA